MAWPTATALFAGLIAFSCNSLRHKTDVEFRTTTGEAGIED
jgi:hypothetical protein